jgi:hypothetical protein
VSEYEVECRWQDGSWVVTDVQGRHRRPVRCRRLRHAEDRFARAVHAATGEPVASIQVRVTQIGGLPEFAGGPVPVRQPGPGDPAAGTPPGGAGREAPHQVGGPAGAGASTTTRLSRSTDRDSEAEPTV